MSTGVTWVFVAKSIIGGRWCMRGNKQHEQAAGDCNCLRVACVPKNSEALGIGSGRPGHVFRPATVLLRRYSAGDPPSSTRTEGMSGHEIAMRVERRPPIEASTIESTRNCGFRSRNGDEHRGERRSVGLRPNSSPAKWFPQKSYVRSVSLKFG